MTGTGWRSATPGFLMGVALAMLGEVAAGLLLYGGPGFLPALSVVLATLFVALGAGLLSEDGRSGRTGIEGARTLWFHALIAFALAAAFAAGWEIFRGFGALGLTQAIGLAVLVALPFHAGGRVLGGLARLPGTRGRGRVAGSALFGGALGVLTVGFVFFPTLSPTAVILISLVAVSGGALVHGWALDEVFWVDSSERFTGRGGVFQVERWVRGNPRTVRLAIRENGRLRALVDSNGDPATVEEGAIVEWIEETGAPPGRLLSLGLGAVILGEVIRRRGTEWDHLAMTADPDGAAEVIGAMERFLGMGGRDPDAPVRHLDLDPALLHGPGGSRPPLPDLPPASMDWILLDALSVSATPGGLRLPLDGLNRLQRLLRPGGRLIVFPLLELPDGGDLMNSVLKHAEGFERSALYVGPRDEFRGVEVIESRGFPREPVPAGSRRAFLVASAGAPLRGGGLQDADPQGSVPPWPESVGGFLRVTRTGDPP